MTPPSTTRPPEQPDKSPASPLHHLAHLLRSLDFHTAVTYLLSHPLLTTTPLPNGHTPLQFASLLGSTHLVEHLLLSTSADPLSIVYAASNNHTAVLSLLLPHPPCPPTQPVCLCNLHVPNASPALYTAAWFNHLPTMQLLLSKLCPRSLPHLLSHRHPNYNHRTTLHAAALTGNHTLVDEILNAGANPLLLDAQQMTARDWARRFAVASSSGELVVELLKKAEVRYESWSQAQEKKKRLAKCRSSCNMVSLDVNQAMPCVARRVQRAASSPALKGAAGVIGGVESLGRRQG